ncbi:CRISPR-associated endonuclease Cas1, partial [Rhodovulum adriaticum]
MVGRIVELSRTGLAVHKRRGFLAVDEGGTEAGRIGLADIEAVLAASPGLMWSNTALSELAARQVPVMVLGPAFTPVAVVLPLNGHHAQAERFRAQAEATLPMRKQAWAVSPRFLPQRLVLDAGDDVGFGDEVFEEAVPL